MTGEIEIGRIDKMRVHALRNRYKAIGTHCLASEAYSAEYQLLKLIRCLNDFES